MRGLALLLLLLSACSAPRISPSNIQQAELEPALELRYLDLWADSVLVCNEFLGSSHRKTLPPGEIKLQPDGMVFVSGQARWPLEVHCCAWGDLVVLTGFEAQERTRGFVVGGRGEGPRVVANSLFHHANGRIKTPRSVADLILHELTHVIYEQGTVGFWNSLFYYVEVVFTWKTTDHSAEELPNATSREFRAFLRAVNA